MRELRAWASLTRTLAEQGWDIEAALSSAWQQVAIQQAPPTTVSATSSQLQFLLAALQVYATPASFEAASRIFQSCVEGKAGLHEELSLYSPCRWPTPILLSDWERSCSSTAIARDFSLIEKHLYCFFATAATASRGSNEVPALEWPSLWQANRQLQMTLTGVEGQGLDAR